MRALVIRNAYFHDFGGGERFPVHLAQELTKNGIDPIVVSRSPKLLAYATSNEIESVKGWWWQKQDWSGKNLLFLPLYLIWQLILFFWYIQLVLKHKPSVVHPQSKDDFIASTLAARFLGKKVIWTDHADLKYVYQNHRIWFKNPVGKLVFYASKLAHEVTLVSHSEASLIEKSIGHALPSNYQIIHNGVLDETIEPVERTKGTLIFCATSRLVTAKGIGELIEAFIELNKTQSACELWLVGDGPERNKFERIAANHPNILFKGHSDLPLSFVAACDVFVHPSHHEGFSLSLVEAAMLSKPIIACKVGGNPEIIKHDQTGILVNEKDVNSLLSAMQTLQNDTSLRKFLGSNARTLYLKEFQFDKIVKEKFIPLYEK